MWQMTKNKTICPACGSGKVKQTEFEYSEQITLGPKLTFNQINYKCSACGEEGGETDKNYLVAQNSARECLVKNIIEDLNIKNISMAFFERVFELPILTLTRWKTGNFSSSSIALLRVIKTYPWITEVAEHRFDPNVARSILVREAARTDVEKP